MTQATAPKISKKDQKLTMGDSNNPVLIKKYANRKIYDTQKSEYITLTELQAMVDKDIHIKVVENETKKDITAATLLDILVQKAKASLDLNDQQVQEKIRTLVKNASLIG